MSLTQKIGAQIRSAKALNPNARIADFQVRVSGRGAVLVNLKTGEVKWIAADKSDADCTEQSLIQ
jgi:hypothetical protein